MAQGWTGFLSAWDEFRVKAEEYRELDGERVLVFAHFSARGRASGLEVAPFTTTRGGANLFHLRGGRVTRLVVYWDRARAFAELGLAE
jgi:ketosteroid isomerase-like protein